MAGPDYEKVAARDSPDERQGYDSDSDSDGDGDDYTGRISRQSRTSADRRRYDDETLTQEEEAERLLAGGSGGRKGRSKRSDKSERETLRMEQGGESGRSSVVSSEEDLQRLGGTRTRRKGRQSWFARYGRLGVLYVVIMAAFLGLLYGAYRATGAGRAAMGKTTHEPKELNNGTHTFAPTTILLSLDGFRADFLHRNLTPALDGFIRQGVSPKYMHPSFPSVTFPNHFTLVTGRYPESHGLVGNTFWDPNTEKEFYYTDPERSMQPEWWQAEPVWETAELAGLRSAIHMWPGSEAHIGSVEPMYVDKFNSKERLDLKTERILGWLDLPAAGDSDASTNATRPQLIAAYVPNVDADGHKFGPNSTEIRGTIASVDQMLSLLFAGLDARNLSEVVNVIIVSDHGMATTSTSRLIQFEDLIDPSLIAHTDGWPLYGLRPYDSSEANLDQLYTDLHAKSQSEQYRGKFEVYLRDKNMPERYHFASNPRIAPLWIVPTTGWAIVKKNELDVELAQKGSIPYAPAGLHGYDHEHPLMRAIFAARGPAFPHTPGSEVEVFQNTEVYNVVCDSLGLDPVPNNGTLRLPFKPMGVHAIPGPGEWIEDPMPDGATIPAIVPVPIPSEMPAVEEASKSGNAKVVWTTDAQGSLITFAPGAASAETEWTTDAQGSLVTAVPEAVDDEAYRKPATDEHEGEDENLNNKMGWWQWAKDQFGKAKGWAAGVLNGGNKDDESSPDAGSSD